MTRRTRVLHLTDRLGQRGGADWHLLGVLRAQAKRWGGEAVHLAVGRRDDPAPGLPCPVTVLPGLGSRERAPVELGSLLAEVRPRLIHLHNVVNPTALEQAVGAGLPALATVQDHRSFCPGRGKWTTEGEVCREPMSRERCAGCLGQTPYLESMIDLTRARLDALRGLVAVTVLSAYMKRELVGVGLSDARVHVIPPFVHGLDDAGAGGDPCVLFVGRLVSAKGPLDAVEAWRRGGLDLPLVLAGTGSARQEIERAAPEARVEGWVDRRQLAALYRRARVVLFPCRWQEPFGIVGLEALTLGVPVAAWDSGGVVEWHPGAKHGLVARGDIDGLARAARQLVGSRAAAPPGFESGPLMDRLHRLYRQVEQGA